jgi:mRNA interferase MazF
MGLRKNLGTITEMSSMNNLRRGEVWKANLDPIKGHEQAGERPVLIISDDSFNKGPADLVIALPITSKLKPIPTRVSLTPPEAGLKVPSEIICEAIRSLSKGRLMHFYGTVSDSTLQAVEYRLKMLLRL